MLTPTRCLVACIVALITATTATATSTVDVTPDPAPTTTSTTSTTSTTLTVAIPTDARCGQWWAIAKEAQFTDEMMPTLDVVLWRESRCDPAQHNEADPNGGSYGLMQINGFWCEPSRYYPLGYLQTAGVLNTCLDLHDPKINLHAAYALVEYSRSMGLCTWSQWAWLDSCN